MVGCGEGLVLKAVVTGGAGFIGSHLCRALLEKGLEVTCLDNLSTGAARNVSSIRGEPAFTFLEHDVTEEIPVGLSADYVFHLASPASVSDYLSLPLETLRVNSLGTLNMLECAQRQNAQFLFTSTSEAYGDPLVHPQTETYWGNVNPNGPRSCYDESKRLGESATFVYHRTYGMNARVVRIFNTYGPHSRVDDGRVVPNFITQALTQQPMTIYGDGSQTRSYCYVSDLVQGILAAMFESQTSGEVFNLGNPEERTVLEFAQMIAERLGSSAGIQHRPLPVDDPVKRRPDISKARTVLGWEPRVGLSEGIELTSAWFREMLSAPATP